MSVIRNSRSRRFSLVSVAVATALCGAMPAAFAQDADADGLSEVVVRLPCDPRRHVPPPRDSALADELLQANPQSISQALATLPSMSGSTTPKTIGGRTTLGPGSFLNLRNLGNNRNLVLLDGRRLVPANIAGNTDINLLPQGLIKSVSVVTGGASAAYGSDAVAGVTNFILDTRFEGLKADLNGVSPPMTVTVPHSSCPGRWRLVLDGRLHVISSFDWRKSQQATRKIASGRTATARVPVPGVTPATMTPTNPRQTVGLRVTQPPSSYGGAIVTGPLNTPAQGITLRRGGYPSGSRTARCAAPTCR